MGLSYNNVLVRLKEQRSSKSLSQNEMAQITHMTQSNYSKVELALRRLSFNELKYLCASPIDVYYIFTGRVSNNQCIDFLYSCNYSELSGYLNVIYAVILYYNKKDTSKQLKSILKRISYVPLIMQNDNSKNIFLILRHTMNCRQKKMAEEMGVDIKKFRDLEKGRCLPDSELLWRLYDLFYIPPTVLLEDKAGMISEIATILDAIDIDYRESILNILKNIHKIK